MEYPIIDTLTNAYIRNGWTGLGLIEGKNIWIPFMTYSNGYISATGEEVYSAGGKYTNKYTKVIPNTAYTWSFVGEMSQSVICSISAYDENKNFIGRLGSAYPTNFPITFTTTDNTFYLRFSVGLIIPNFQLEIGTEATPYEPYYATTDIFSRTRLPIIRHYPYALIDALQRASTGTQTADDTEVLRHYLTPLGIGGI